MKTVHLIFNAHLDPIWLWPWYCGVTEALATARSVCDQLDECSDLIFTRGESWFYEQIQRHDPQTFERIRKHIEAGRWEITGGWYIQPDCNQPGKIGFQKQIELGKSYFQNTFNRFPDIGYNVDSFGHNASLPQIMRDAGQKHYIMMRPGSHEMKLPARVFRWRGHENGPIVTTFRIAEAYTTPFGITEDHVRASLTELPDGIDHTMCFVGLGDHGGGPSRAMTQWCRDHAEAFPGVKLVFSSPSRFFKAIAGHENALPLVTGELQHHAVGCYPIARQIKTQLRKAESDLERAQIAIHGDKAASAFDTAWRHVCFHHFHDTLGGTCIPSAYAAVQGEVGAAAASANEMLRRKMIDIAESLPDDKRQRMVIWNPGPNHFSGYIEYEPWLEWTHWPENRRIEDEAGRAIPYQIMASEALVNPLLRICMPCTIAPQQVAVLAFDPWDQASGQPVAPVHSVKADGLKLGNDSGAWVDFGASASMQLRGLKAQPPRLALIPDATDTWSHSVDHYATEGMIAAEITETRVVDSGPLVASVIQYGKIGSSPFEAEWRVYAGEAAVHLHLHVEWVERQHVLKLIWDLPAQCSHREDGIPGGVLRREPTGLERPLRDLTRVHLKDGHTVGIACPDTFALDGSEKQIRLTLLRSPVMAHHDPTPAQSPRRRFSDRGEHTFNFIFVADEEASIERLEALAARFWMPPLATDLTRGMPKRLMREKCE